MDEVWEKAVKTALDGQTDDATVKTLTLDGVVKCYQGKLPSQNLLEKFKGLEHLSIANVGVSSLERFPCITTLQKLNLSDNRIVRGLEFLVKAGLDSLTDLDLSNNRIQAFEDLAPFAELKLVSLDLYECPVTKIKDYRSRVFGLIKSLQFLDKMDVDGNEVLESDEDEEDDDEEDEEEDGGCGEVDGEGKSGKKMNNGGAVDGEEESDADEGAEEDGESAEEDGGAEEENEEEDEEEDEEEVDDEEDQNGEVLVSPPSPSHSKRKRAEVEDNGDGVDDDGVVDASSL
ncbi:hypothetical protein MKW94_000812 [Papaver nudicaule]|uniref:Acidic leucine-rich nuclear phosphoprotein 32-related protein n=1 Tax=Papaver nudicaule TaxID=74823 RepID=A0AA41RUU7_PAPNU|nr:hypothetical protein [Papaver nudicaule]